MRIISAHYAWTEQSLIKNPLITINASHEIVEVKSMGENYKEHTHTEYFGGLIIPGFLSEYYAEGVVSLDAINLFLDKSFVNGSFYSIVNSSIYKQFALEERLRPKVLTPLENKNSTIPWLQLKQDVDNRTEADLMILLEKYLVQPWKNTKQEYIGGSFTLGTKPGALLLTGVDWTSMTFTPNLTMKIIDTPY